MNKGATTAWLGVSRRAGLWLRGCARRLPATLRMQGVVWSGGWNVCAAMRVSDLLRLHKGLYHYAFLWDPEPPCVVRHCRGLIWGACMPAERKPAVCCGWHRSLWDIAFEQVFAANPIDLHHVLRHCDATACLSRWLIRVGSIRLSACTDVL